tara:strand:+ start:1639 stop:1773 length:135 start_codon:yes stop_codon:yes gene_type:complete
MRVDNPKKVIEWFNNFADYIEKSGSHHLYQDAIDYADKCEKLKF